MNTTTATRPAILDTVDTLDTFSTPAAVTVTGSKLRGGMVLLDPMLGTPAVWIDSMARSTRNSGAVKFLGHDLETGRISTYNITATTDVEVMGR